MDLQKTCLQRFFEFFKKENKFYKEKCGTVKKIKSVKNVIIKKSATKVFQLCISIVYDSVSWNLVFSKTLSPIA